MRAGQDRDRVELHRSEAAHHGRHATLGHPGAAEALGASATRRASSMLRLSVGHSQLRRLATTLIASATITAPKRYDIKACDSAIRRTALVVRLVSETWKVLPMVKAR